MNPVKNYKQHRQARKERKAAGQEYWGRPIYTHGPFVRRALAAYVAMALAITYSLALERIHSNSNRAEVARATRITLRAGCERNNDLRHTLQQLILGGNAQIRVYVKEGTLTPTQGQRAIRQSKDNAKRLGPVDCTKLYGRIK